MAWSGFLRNALLGLALAGFSAPPVEAVEIVSGAQPPAPLSDGLLTQVRSVRHGGGGARHGGGAHRPAHARRRARRFIAPAAGIGRPSTVRRSTVPAIARR